MQPKPTPRLSKALATLAAVAVSVSALGVFVVVLDTPGFRAMQLHQQVLPAQIDPSPRLQIASAPATALPPRIAATV